MIKLSPAMQVAMWEQFYADNGQPYFLMMRDATAHALSRRGLFNLAARTLTDAGRAWIVEQIEAARAEALEMNLDRYRGADASDEDWSAAWRLAARSGYRSSLPWTHIERDRIDALREHVRRAQALSSKHNGFHGTLAAELVALALAARWDVVDCPEEIIERDSELTWQLYRLAFKAKELREIGKPLRALALAQDIGYSLDVLRKIAA